MRCALNPYRIAAASDPDLVSDSECQLRLRASLRVAAGLHREAPDLSPFDRCSATIGKRMLNAHTALLRGL